MHKFYKDLAILLSFLLLTVALNFKALTAYPYEEPLHAWAQTDFYALSLGYVENGLDFWHPQTFVINKQFPGQINPQVQNVITSADFPLVPYLSAICMKTFGSDSPIFFRLIMMLWSVIAFWALYKTMLLLNNNHKIVSYTLTMLVFSAPTFLYYQCGFLGGTAALYSAFIGVYFFVKYTKEDKRRDYIIACSFLLLAALMRTTFIMAFLAMAGADCIALFIKENKKNKGLGSLLHSLLRKYIHYRLPALVCCITVWLCFYLHNQHLREVYGSIFLGSLLPATSLVDYISTFIISFQKFKFHYATLPYYGLFAILSILFIFKKRFKHIGTNTPVDFKSPLILFLMLWFLADFLFTIVMTRQFIDHPHYWYDTFFIPLAVLLGVLYNSVHSFFETKKIIFYVLAGGLILSSVANGIWVVERKRSFVKDANKDPFWYNLIHDYGSLASLLDECGVKPDAVIMTLGAEAPNIPLVMAKRKGYAIMNSMKFPSSYIKDMPYSVIVVQKSFYPEKVLDYYPSFDQEFVIIGENNDLIILNRRDLTVAPI